MPNIKSDLNRLAALIVRDALAPGTTLDTRIAALKAVTVLHLGEGRIRAGLKAKGVLDDDDEPSATVTDFRAIRDRVRAVKEEG